MSCWTSSPRCAQAPDLRLIQVGGPWTAAQHEHIERLGLGDAVMQLRGLTRPQLAGLYRHAALVLQPSEAEGFGLPVAEALACGATVIASDLPSIREAGGSAVVFAPVGDVLTWAELVTKVLTEPTAAPSKADRLTWAGRFSWAAHAETIAAAYYRLLDGTS